MCIVKRLNKVEIRSPKSGNVDLVYFYREDLV